VRSATWGPGRVARLLVFDLDGTLVDSSRDIAAAMNEALRRLAPGTAAIPLERILAFVGEGARLLVERALEHAGLALAPDEVLAVYLECYRGRLLDTTRLYPGLAEALAAFGPAGPALAVLTNKPGDMSRAILAGLGVADRFARVWGAGDVPSRKPDPAGLLALMAELSAAAAETWMVGDSATDVGAARAAGVRVAGVAWGFHPAELRSARPDRVLEHPRELAGLAAL
jgi:phosphoglycolate phosphatase